MSPLQKRNFRSYNPAFNRSTPNDRKRTTTMSIGTVTAALNRDIFRAGSEVLIDQISIVTDVAVPVSGANFWQFDVKLISAALAGTVGPSLLAAPVVTSTTAIAANVNYDLNPTANLTLGPNDVLQLQMVEGGSAANLQDLMVIIDYEVTGNTTTTSTSTTTTTTTTTSTTTSTSSTTTTTISTTTTLT